MSSSPARVGRPRGFDREQALQKAMTQFWQHGYEATSVASLTRAMGVNPPSLYAAFGDKRQLFSEAVQLYARTHGGYGAAALARPDARSAVETMLRLAAAEYTDPTHPPGCLVIDGATNCGPGSQDVAEELRDIRRATTDAIAQKIRTDVDRGLLPAATDAASLAAFYAAVVQGMSTQARDGATREQLEQLADVALRAWPVRAAS